MNIRTTRIAVTRATSDAMSVLRHARPVNAAQWIGALIAHAPAIVRTRSLCPADRAWTRAGARFRAPSGRTVYLPGTHTAGAREMYCRNVYLTTGLSIPAGGWVVDLGANAGLFTVLAAVEGARVVAVEAQRGFVPEIRHLLRLNGADQDRVHIEVGLAASADAGLALVGVVADDARWRTASHADPRRPARVSVPELMDRHGIDRIGLLKADIEGSEFSLFDAAGDVSWLRRVDQIAMEVHPPFGSVERLHATLLTAGFTVLITDNDGRVVPAGSPAATYMYCRRGTSATAA